MFESKPRLRKHLLHGVRGADTLKSTLAVNFPDHVVEHGPGLNDIRAEIGLCPLDKIQLFYGRWESLSRIRMTNARHFMQGFPINGTGETICNGFAMSSSPSRGASVEPGAVTFSPAPNFEHLVTLIESDALADAIAALVGAPIVAPLKLDLANFESWPNARLSRGLVKLLVEELNAEDSVSPLVIAELEQAILVAFLYGNRHNYSDLLNGRTSGAAPWQIRRVEEYIEANWDQPITIEALAVVANASARSIFHSFKEHRRYSPMTFVKHVRLGHAREMLSGPAQPTTVTSVAFACGFGNLGHFASDYKRAFGEMPSATLLRSRNGAQPRVLAAEPSFPTDLAEAIRWPDRHPPAERSVPARR